MDRALHNLGRVQIWAHLLIWAIRVLLLGVPIRGNHAHGLVMGLIMGHLTRHLARGLRLALRVLIPHLLLLWGTRSRCSGTGWPIRPVLVESRWHPSSRGNLDLARWFSALPTRLSWGVHLSLCRSWSGNHLRLLMRRLRLAVTQFGLTRLTHPHWHLTKLRVLHLSHRALLRLALRWRLLSRGLSLCWLTLRRGLGIGPGRVSIKESVIPIE